MDSSNSDSLNEDIQNLRHLYKLWKARNYTLDYYFSHLFDKVIAALRARVAAGGHRLTDDQGQVYKAMFVPVGFSVENIALAAALFSPSHLTLAFSGETREAHRKYFDKVRDNVSRFCPTVHESQLLLSDNQDQAARAVSEWAMKMRIDKELRKDQMAIDLTGGTKPMSIGAQNAAVSLGIAAYYLSADYDLETHMPIPGTENLHRMTPLSEADLVFVIMPFHADYNPVYDEIQKAAAAAGMRCTRADEEIFQGGIMDNVREMLVKAGVVIADLSGKNLNVYYELGIAHAWSKDVIILTNDIKDVPFDLKHLRLIAYDRNNVNELSTKVPKEIMSLRKSAPPI
jgi:hypothetical protein